MLKIAENLDEGEASKEITCQGRWVVLSVSGTLDTEVLTVQASPDGGANWFTYRSDDPAGSPESATFAAADVSTGLYSRLFVAGDQRLRVIMSTNSGSSTGVDVYAGGVGVDVIKSSVQGVPA